MRRADPATASVRDEPPLAVTMGDPAGIGLDITLLAWLKRACEALPAFVLVGDADRVQKRARQLNVAVPLATVPDFASGREAFAGALPVLPVPATAPGQIVAAIVMLLGIGFVTVITASITGAFVARSRLEQHLEGPDAAPAGNNQEIIERLERIEAALASQR